MFSAVKKSIKLFTYYYQEPNSPQRIGERRVFAEIFNSILVRYYCKVYLR